MLKSIINALIATDLLALYFFCSDKPQLFWISLIVVVLVKYLYYLGKALYNINGTTSKTNSVVIVIITIIASTLSAYFGVTRVMGGLSFTIILYYAIVSIMLAKAYAQMEYGFIKVIIAILGFLVFKLFDYVSALELSSSWAVVVSLLLVLKPLIVVGIIFVVCEYGCSTGVRERDINTQGIVNFYFCLILLLVLVTTLLNVANLFIPGFGKALNETIESMKDGTFKNLVKSIPLI